MTNHMLNTDNILIATLRKKLDLTSEKLYQLQSYSPNNITSPLEMKDTQNWVDLLYAHRFDPIGIIPDYDADGVLSGSLLYGALFELGFTDVTIYTPRITTGYGMSETSVKELLDLNPNIATILTTDNGIAAFEGIAYAKKLGKTVLVSDHHLGNQKEPNFDSAVNPNRYNDPSTFKGGAGTVIIWKLMVWYAACYVPDKMAAIYNLFPFAGISNIADVMPITDENRTLVKMTVKAFSQKINMHQAKLGHHPKYERLFDGLIELWGLFNENGKLKYGVNEDLFGFSLVPMLNSPRRMTGSSKLGFEMFIDFDESPTPLETAHALDNLNQLRKNTVNEIAACVIDTLLARYQASNIPACITVAVDTKPGIAGLISSQITNQFGVPSLVFAKEFNIKPGEILTQADLNSIAPTGMAASARSPEAFNIKTALDAVDTASPGLLDSYGGHAGAAGAHINSTNFEKFVLATETVFAQVAAQIEFDPKQIESRSIGKSFLFTPKGHYSRSTYQFEQDAVSVESLVELTKFVDSLRPFGQGFKEPQFTVAIDTTSVKPTPLGKAQVNGHPKHVKFQLTNMSVIYWNVSQTDLERFEAADLIYVTGKFSINSFNGNDSIQLIANKTIFN